MKDPAFIDYAKKMGLTLSYQGPDEFGKYLAENADLVDKTMDSIGLKKK